MSQAEKIITINLRSNRKSGLVTLCAAWLLITCVPAAFAQASEQGRQRTNEPGAITAPAVNAPQAVASASDAVALPSVESIGEQTDITVFLQKGVPARLRLAALRRAWTVDPAVRDFRGLQENDWDFNDPNGVPGFGELGPEVDLDQMVAEILGETPRVVARAERPTPALFTRVMLRLF